MFVIKKKKILISKCDDRKRILFIVAIYERLRIAVIKILLLVLFKIDNFGFYFKFL